MGARLVNLKAHMKPISRNFVATYNWCVCVYVCIIGFKCRSQWIDWSFWLFVSPVYSTTVWTTVFYLEVTGNHPAILALKEWNPLPFIKEKINIWSGEKTSRVLCLWLAMIFSHMFFFNGLVAFTFLFFNHFRKISFALISWKRLYLNLILMENLVITMLFTCY